MERFVVVNITDDDFTKVKITSIGSVYIQAASIVSSIINTLMTTYYNVNVEDQVPLYNIPGDIRSFVGFMTKVTYKQLDHESHTERYYILMCADSDYGIHSMTHGMHDGFVKKDIIPSMKDIMSSMHIESEKGGE